MTDINKIFNIKDKVIVITGGNGYLCGNLAIGLFKLGCKLVIIDKKIKKNSIYYKELKKNLSSFLFINSDVTKKNNLFGRTNQNILTY